MATEEAEEKPPLPLEPITAGALAVAAEQELAGAAARFLEQLQAWASPSVVLCVGRDPAAEAGWRLVPALTYGPVPQGAERSFAKLIEEAPSGSLVRPTLVRPADDVPGFKVRDTWVIPWSHAGASGFLVLRGIPRPYPPNLGDAIALLSQPLWSRVAAFLGREQGPRVETLLDEVRQMADRLERGVRAELEQLRADRAAMAAAQAPAPAVDEAQVAALSTERDEARRQAQAAEAGAQSAAQSAEQARAALQKERDEARTERDQIQKERDEARSQRDEARTEREEARAKLAELEEARKKLAELRTQLEALTPKLDAEAARATSLEKAKEDSERARSQAEKTITEAEKARVDAEQARAAAEKAKTEAETEREFAKGEAADLRGRIQGLEKAAEQRVSQDTQLEEAQRQLQALQEKVTTSDKARAAAEAERDQAKNQINQLWASIESLQRQLQAEKDTLEATHLDVGSKHAALERERDEAKAAFGASLERVKLAESQERQLSERWEKTIGAFRGAIEALRRTPFVPPTLRVSLAEAERFVDSADRRPTSKLARVLFLDRDMTTLERLALDLEVAGVDVLIAHYPEEITFFLKTPDARGLSALVCDVMAFRPDQNLTDLVKAWRQDLPTLGVFLSFKADNPAESEKAQRIPTVLTAGYLPRPLQKDGLVEAFGSLGKRSARR